MLNLRWWEDVGLSMAICLTLYPSHELSSYTVLGMWWLFFKSIEFSSRGCAPAIWWVSCRTDGWHVDSQIKSTLLQIIEVRFDLFITPQPPIGVHIGRMVKGLRGVGIHKPLTKIFHMFQMTRTSYGVSNSTMACSCKVDRMETCSRRLSSRKTNHSCWTMAGHSEPESHYCVMPQPLHKIKNRNKHRHSITQIKKKNTHRVGQVIRTVVLHASIHKAGQITATSKITFNYPYHIWCKLICWYGILPNKFLLFQRNSWRWCFVLVCRNCIFHLGRPNFTETTTKQLQWVNWSPY